MDFLTLSTAQTAGRSVKLESSTISKPLSDRQSVFKLGPPGTGAPPPDKEAAGPQKEVNANEQKPQATILDLLEEILPVNLFSLLPRQNQAQLSEFSDIASFGTSLGNLNIDANQMRVSDLLTSLGIDLPKDIDTLSEGQIRKAVAEQIIQSTMPSSLRGALASLLQVSNGSTDAQDSLGKPELSFGGVPDSERGSSNIKLFANATPTLSSGPEIQLFSNGQSKPTIGSQSQKSNGSKPQLNSGAQPLLNSGAQPLLNAGAQPLLTSGPEIQLSNRPVFDQEYFGVRQIGPPIQVDSDSSESGSSDARLGPKQRHDHSAGLHGRMARENRVRTIGSLRLGTQTVGSRNKSDAAAQFDQVKQTADALNMSTNVPKMAATTAIDFEQLADNVMRKFANDRASVKQLAGSDKPVVMTKESTLDSQSNGNPLKFKEQTETISKPAIGITPNGDEKFSLIEESDILVNSIGKDSSSLDIAKDDRAGAEDVKGIMQFSEVTPSKSTVQVSSKVDLAMERVAEVQNKIIEQVQEMAAMRGNSRVTIRLNPDDLGTITLVVSSFGNKVDTKISASNESVRHALHLQRPDLVQGIESRGLNLNSFTVGQESGSEAQAQNQNNANSEQGTMRQDFERASNLASAQSPAPTQASSPSHYVSRSDKAVDYLA